MLAIVASLAAMDAAWAGSVARGPFVISGTVTSRGDGDGILLTVDKASIPRRISEAYCRSERKHSEKVCSITIYGWGPLSYWGDYDVDGDGDADGVTFPAKGTRVKIVAYELSERTVEGTVSKLIACSVAIGKPVVAEITLREIVDKSGVEYLIPLWRESAPESED